MFHFLFHFICCGRALTISHKKTFDFGRKLFRFAVATLINNLEIANKCKHERSVYQDLSEIYSITIQEQVQHLMTKYIDATTTNSNERGEKLSKLKKRKKESYKTLS